MSSPPQMAHAFRTDIEGMKRNRIFTLLGTAAAATALLATALVLSPAVAEQATPQVQAAPAAQAATSTSPYAVPTDAANGPTPDLEALARESSKELTDCLKGMNITPPYSLTDAQTSSCFSSTSTRYRLQLVESKGIRGITPDFTSNRYEIHFGANTSPTYMNGDTPPLTACTFYYNYTESTYAKWCDGTLHSTRKI